MAEIKPVGIDQTTGQFKPVANTDTLNATSFIAGTTNPLTITESTITRTGGYSTLTIGDSNGGVAIIGGGASGDVISINAGAFGNIIFGSFGNFLRWNGTGFIPMDTVVRDLGSSTLKWRTSYQEHTVNSVLSINGTTSLGATSPEFIECTVASSYTVTLPPVASCAPGRRFVIKDNGSASGSNVLTIDGDGAETIDGAASATINAPYERFIVFLNAAGTAWLVEGA